MCYSVLVRMPGLDPIAPKATAFSRTFLQRPKMRRKYSEFSANKKWREVFFKKVIIKKLLSLEMCKVLDYGDDD